MYMGGIPSLSETTVLLISKQAREKVKNLFVHHLILTFIIQRAVLMRVDKLVDGFPLLDQFNNK